MKPVVFMIWVNFVRDDKKNGIGVCWYTPDLAGKFYGEFILGGN